jgi:hypothetical protein
MSAREDLARAYFQRAERERRLGVVVIGVAPREGLGLAWLARSWQ